MGQTNNSESPDRIYFEQGSDNDDMSDEEEQELDNDELERDESPEANTTTNNISGKSRLEYKQLPVGAKTTKQNKAKQGTLSNQKQKQLTTVSGNE